MVRDTFNNSGYYDELPQRFVDIGLISEENVNLIKSALSFVTTAAQNVEENKPTTIENFSLALNTYKELLLRYYRDVYTMFSKDSSPQSEDQIEGQLRALLRGSNLDIIDKHTAE
jgi:hypothetical protein